MKWIAIIAWTSLCLLALNGTSESWLDVTWYFIASGGGNIFIFWVFGKLEKEKT